MEESTEKEESENRNQSPRKNVRKDFIFENVCCMPSPLSTQRTLTSSKCICHKSSSARLENSSSADVKVMHPGNISCGKGICFHKDSFDEEGQLNRMADNSNGTLEKEVEMASSGERGGGATSSGNLPSDVVNRLDEFGVASRCVEAGSIISSKKSNLISVDAEINDNTGTDRNIQENGCLDYNTERPFGSPASSKCSPRQTKALLETDLDAIEDDQQAPSASSIRIRPSSIAYSGQQVTSATDILWEISGCKLSSFCQNLIIDCGRFEGETTQTAVFSNRCSRTEETFINGDESSGCCAVEKSEDKHASNDRPPSYCKTGSNGQAYYSSDYEYSLKSLSVKQISVSETGEQKHDSVSGTLDIGISSRTPSSFLPASTIRVDRHLETFESSADATSSTRNPTSFDNNSQLEKSKNISGVLIDRKPADDESEVNRTGVRRGRTLERGKYEASLLKDFIKPEDKKFSIAPSKDLNLDTELAIWEPSDFIQDRHKSAPPTDFSIKEARSEDLLLRSRQTSVSPQRKRLFGPLWIKGSKSAELLRSRNTSPSGSKIRRRTLSKEWQIITLTTREEITTMIKPRELSKDPTTDRDSYQLMNRESVYEPEGNVSRNHGDVTPCASMVLVSDGRGTIQKSPSQNSTNAYISKMPISVNSGEIAEYSAPFVEQDSTIGSQSEVWEVISEALSDAMKAVEIAETETPNYETQTMNSEASSTNQSLVCSTDNSREFSDDSVASNNRSKILQQRCDSGGIIIPGENNPENVSTNKSPPSMEMDDLVRALLEIASGSLPANSVVVGCPGQLDTEHELLNLFDRTPVGITNAGVDDSFMVTQPSKHEETIGLSEQNSVRFKDNLNTSNTENDNLTIIEGDSFRCSGTKRFGNRNDEQQTSFSSSSHGDFSFLEYEEPPHEHETFFADDFCLEDDPILQIMEESDFPNADRSSGLFSAIGSNESIPTRDMNAQGECSDAGESLSDDISCRRREVSQRTGTTEMTSVNQRSENSDMFPEKAFLESLFSSLGTIIFLLLAALIFHLFNRIVEHEL